jgi:hypothetical protein
MTLEEAIIHAEDVAEINQSIANNTEHDNWMDIAQCEKCAEEHRQLAEYLKLLKRILDSGDCNDCAMLHRQCRYAPKWGEQVRYNCPFYSRESEESE